MKKITLILGAMIIATSFFAQVGGNGIYEQNNRYIQNKTYNANQEKVWNSRSDKLILL